MHYAPEFVELLPVGGVSRIKQMCLAQFLKALAAKSFST
jgi:hypothetical protein